MILRMIRGVAILCLLLSWNPRAHAELVPCRSEVDGFKVYADGMLQTDNLSLVRAQHPDLGQLQVILDSVARSIQDLENDLQFQMVRCDDRKPTDDGEFSPGLLSRMFDSKVILEVWGRLDARPDDSGTFQPVAELSYLIIPLRHGALTEPHLQGYYRVDYAGVIERDADSGQPVDHAGEVQPFTALGLGFRHLQDQRFTEAFVAFCAAHRLLKNLPDDLVVADDVDLTQLKQWAADTVWAVQAAAKASPEDNAIQMLGPDAVRAACEVELP